MKKHKSIHLFLALFSTLTFSTIANAHDGHRHESHGGHNAESSSDHKMDAVQVDPMLGSQLEIKAISSFGVDIILSFSEEPAIDTYQARVCFAEGMTLVSAVLWMPGHGHGSAPTTIHADEVESNCAHIESMLFLMAGQWEIQLEFDDGDAATVPVFIADDSRVFKKRSEKNKMRMRLMFADGPDMMTNSATLCIEIVTPVTEVVLWMPAHGHGSVPVTLTPVPDRPSCTLIENIYFLMPGDWDIRIKFGNGDEGVFNVTI